MKNTTTSFRLKRTTILITNLRLRTTIGINEWEREKKQDIIVNVSADFDPGESVSSDLIADSVDYRTIKSSIIELVEKSSYNLLETLTCAILSQVLEHHAITAATVRVDKPFALRYADSIGIEMHGQK